ncbi:MULTISPECIES: SRPBCC domain-containing protein [unclassified Sporosarcina]|uniref:SRPBCC family protein n=1 Tax=unclassified Sporosarcina TaxID=2647733 RepID=UPI000C164F5D|nr:MULTISPECIES: SRPBCC domain-containing protein [unclassified Sporosarcina]PIC70653.1 ATPase [Sporosarcina sp. P16b]PID04076.1 ATPase [Sporosarcina sp. P2]PID24704.1 ATPase [Sporosarcina sp. P7]
MSKVSSTTLNMIRNFNVAPEKVFDAWLNPEMMRKWFFTLEGTNKVTRNNPKVGGTWEIIDHRGGQDYRAIGEYLEIDPPKKVMFTFKMPEMSDLEDTITVELKELEQGCKMTFTQLIHVAQEVNWTESEIEKALTEMHDGTEVGWNYMFMGLKELVETGRVSYTG